MDRPEAPAPSIDPELLEQAARLGLDTTGWTERDLRLHLQKVDPAGGEARAKRWADENAEAIRRHGERIEREGCFGEEWRRW
ncbi:type II toxin-antitoxin system CcdA family antitoxin [Caulobacter mirabilis]|uniref:Post-segregation antitoxin CcdA n=1 Tax=Caulobacter mirabilis TaxID=69666 RepID=A0A2D2AWC7_9CAUL|nr:type II toxin-antitoxin system CcdA family antitoxin [Caulobacter mirabilis]ATQ42310.1 post-segregation antitoxin CcdA [Caulobacter mirabilis]